MSHDGRAAVVQRYYELVDAGDLGLLDLFAPEARYKRPGYAEMIGREDLRAFYAGERLIAHGSHTILSLRTDEAGTAVEGRFEGDLRGGEHVSLPFSDFFDLTPRADGWLISARRTYFDDIRV